MVEASHVGFGASGRNGGWLSGLMPGDRDRLARESAERPEAGGRDGVVALQRHLIDAVGEVVAACAEEGIEADIHLGGHPGRGDRPRPSSAGFGHRWRTTGRGASAPTTSGS